MAKLEDLFAASMKQPRRLLDLSKVKIFNDADFFKYMDKVPELNLRPDKVEPEDIQIVSDFSFTYAASSSSSLARQETILNPNGSSSTATPSSSSTTKSNNKKYFYEDPLPLCMRSTRLEDLWALDIHWKMLTSDRSENRLEEEIFERIVGLGRLALHARKQEQTTIKAIMSSIVGTPAVTYLVALGFITTRTKRGAIETKLKCCKNCGDELCEAKLCKLYHYDAFTRMIMDKDELENQEKEELAFLKAVSKSAGAAGPAAPGPSAAASKKKTQQGKKLKMQIRKTKKRKKKKKVKENLEPVSAPDE